MAGVVIDMWGAASGIRHHISDIEAVACTAHRTVTAHMHHASTWAPSLLIPLTERCWWGGRR